MNKFISGACGVEVKLKSGVNHIFLPDVIDLRRKRIKHLEFYSVDFIGKTPSGNDLILSSVLDNLFLTLVESNTQKELIQSMPAKQFNTNGNRLFINKIVDLQRSYLDLTAITDPTDVTNKSVYIVFWYDEPAVWGNVQMNCRTSIQPLEISLTGLKTYFSENRDLLNKRFLNLLLSFPVITPYGQPGLDMNACVNKFLTLQRNGLQFFHQVPLIFFYQDQQNFPLRLQNIQCDFQSSYIESLSATEYDLKSILFNCIIDDDKNSHCNHNQR
jgi:hypothetical protein